MSKKRIVITGCGVVSPVGNTVSEMWSSLRAGKSGISTFSENDIFEFPTTYGGEIRNLNPQNFLESKELRKMDMLSVYSTIASLECIKNAKINLEKEDKYRVGCVIGVGIGGMRSYYDGAVRLNNDGWKNVPIMTISKIIPNSASSAVALKLDNLCGPNYTVNTACSSATDAIASAIRLLRSDETDIVLAGGAEAVLNNYSIASFSVLHALSTKWSDEPTRASRPFDRDRDGFVIAEGAGILALETLEHAQQRDAEILAEIVGYANTNDGYHYTAPDPDGSGIAHAMRLAIQRAGISPEEISYINAHGTSTKTNDPIETKAIKSVFKDHAYKLKVSSTKSMTGHCIGATGAIEAISCVQALREQFVPPTINLDNPDPECDLDYVPFKGIASELNYAMSNTLGFGGHNSVVLLKKFSS